jgi:hypothetical protein
MAWVQRLSGLIKSGGKCKRFFKRGYLDVLLIDLNHYNIQGRIHYNPYPKILYLATENVTTVKVLLLQPRPRKMSFEENEKKLKNIGMVRRDIYQQSYDKLKLKNVIIVVR